MVIASADERHALHRRERSCEPNCEPHGPFERRDNSAFRRERRGGPMECESFHGANFRRPVLFNRPAEIACLDCIGRGAERFPDESGKSCRCTARWPRDRRRSHKPNNRSVPHDLYHRESWSVWALDRAPKGSTTTPVHMTFALLINCTSNRHFSGSSCVSIC